MTTQQISQNCFMEQYFPFLDKINLNGSTQQPQIAKSFPFNPFGQQQIHHESLPNNIAGLFNQGLSQFSPSIQNEIHQSSRSTIEYLENGCVKNNSRYQNVIELHEKNGFAFPNTTAENMSYFLGQQITPRSLEKSPIQFPFQAQQQSQSSVFPINPNNQKFRPIQSQFFPIIGNAFISQNEKQALDSTSKQNQFQGVSLASAFLNKSHNLSQQQFPIQNWLTPQQSFNSSSEIKPIQLELTSSNTTSTVFTLSQENQTSLHEIHPHYGSLSTESSNRQCKFEYYSKEHLSSQGIENSDKKQQAEVSLKSKKEVDQKCLNNQNLLKGDSNPLLVLPVDQNQQGHEKKKGNKRKLIASNQNQQVFSFDQLPTKKHFLTKEEAKVIQENSFSEIEDFEEQICEQEKNADVSANKSVSLKQENKPKCNKKQSYFSAMIKIFQNQQKTQESIIQNMLEKSKIEQLFLSQQLKDVKSLQKSIDEIILNSTDIQGQSGLIDFMKKNLREISRTNPSILFDQNNETIHGDQFFSKYEIVLKDEFSGSLTKDKNFSIGVRIQDTVTKREIINTHPIPIRLRMYSYDNPPSIFGSEYLNGQLHSSIVNGSCLFKKIHAKHVTSHKKNRALFLVVEVDSEAYINNLNNRPLKIAVVVPKPTVADNKINQPQQYVSNKNNFTVKLENFGIKQEFDDEENEESEVRYQTNGKGDDEDESSKIQYKNGKLFPKKKQIFSKVDDIHFKINIALIKPLILEQIVVKSKNRK